MNTPRIQQLFDFLEGDPNDAFTLYSIAFEFLKAGNAEKAIQYFQHLKELHPNYIGLYYHLGKSYEFLELKEKAVEIYQLGTEIAERNQENHALEELKRAIQQLNDELMF